MNDSVRGEEQRPEPVRWATGAFTWSELMGFLVAYYRIYSNSDWRTGVPWKAAKKDPITRPLLIRRSLEQLKDKRKNMENSDQVSSGRDGLLRHMASHESSCPTTSQGDRLLRLPEHPSSRLIRTAPTAWTIQDLERILRNMAAGDAKMRDYLATVPPDEPR